MSTILRQSYIFGPVHSRRLGVSLGVNVLPIEQKLCNFNCIYCECGWNTHGHNKSTFPDRDIIKTQLIEVLSTMDEPKKLDVITFSGNGEPTLHPDFAGIIDDTIAVRNEYAPNAKVSVLSNATNLLKPAVFAALQKVDNPILKLDSAIIETLNRINLPVHNISIADIISGMQQFNGNFILQTMFLRGEHNGKSIDNTTETELKALLACLEATHPRQVMIYPIDRDTPADSLVKLSQSEMQAIAATISEAGFNVLYV